MSKLANLSHFRTLTRPKTNNDLKPCLIKVSSRSADETPGRTSLVMTQLGGFPAQCMPKCLYVKFVCDSPEFTYR